MMTSMYCEDNGGDKNKQKNGDKEKEIVSDNNNKEK